MRFLKLRKKRDSSEHPAPLRELTYEEDQAPSGMTTGNDNVLRDIGKKALPHRGMKLLTDIE